MKKIFITCCTLLAILTASSQSGTEIAEKHIAAMGGQEAFKNAKTVKITGSVTVQGMELPMEQYIINDRAVKTVVEVMGTEVISSYKDGKGWKKNQFAGAPDPVAVDGAELAEQAEQSSLANALMAYKTNGSKLEASGQETINGVNLFRIKSSAKDGEVTTYFINASTYDLVKTTGVKHVNGESLQIETKYEDYKTVNGMRLPFLITISASDQQQLLTIQKYEVNIPIDEKIFDMP